MALPQRIASVDILVTVWNANDVEFVLAPPRNNQAPQNIIKSEVLGDHTMWILDFDCCKHVSLDKVDVVEAVLAFHKNDPFYSRPECNEKDRALWTKSRARCLKRVRIYWVRRKLGC